MNASDNEAFEDTVKSLASTENLKIEVHTTANILPKTKSAIKFMASYKGF